MGNYGKRVLIVLVAVAAVVALAVAGNAFQQRNKEHTISHSKEVVYQGEYNGTSYDVTKADVWKNILYSSPLSTMNEMVEKLLLKDIIANISDNELIDKKIEYLIYSTNDAEAIESYQKDPERDEELKNSFEMRMAILGYFENGSEGHTWNDYAKLLIAKDIYAKYRIENELPIGSYTFDLSDETLTKEYKEAYKDTYAITLKFYSEGDATSFLKSMGYVTVSNRLRQYVGDREFELQKNSSGSYYVNDDLSLPFVLVDVTYNDETTGQEKVPFGNIQKDEDGNFVWDQNSNSFVLSGEEFVSSSVSIWDAESFTNDNTAYLSDEQLLKVYINLYNEYYKQQRSSIKNTISLDDFANAFGFTKVGELYSDENVATMNGALKAYDLVIVNNNGNQEIRKYVGNEEYVVDLDEDGHAIGSYGLPTYKKSSVNTEQIPNYQIKLDEDGEPVLDVENEFIFYLDRDGNKVANESKKAIADQTTFDLSNTIPTTDLQLYSAFYSIYLDVTGTEWTNEYKNSADAASSILYKYADLSSKRSDVAKQIFVTFEYNTSTAAQLLYTPTSFTGANNSETPYYLIYKLTDSKTQEPTEAQLKEYKEDKIAEYLKEKGLVDMAIAELKKESGLAFYDQFFAWDYEATLASDDDNNPAGISEDKIENYFKNKAYSNSKLLSLKTPTYVKYDSENKIVVESSKDKYVITANDLYDYSMEYASASYVSSATLSNILLLMKEFEEIHGTTYAKSNYLTSKNWKLEQYATTTQNYNYYFEFYKQMYAQYGLSYYDTLNEFLHSYNTRSFDDLVDSLMKGTMRNLYLYKAIVGEFKEITDLSTFDLTEYGNTLFNQDEFNKLYDDYFDVNVNHILFYVDLDEDGNPDDYKDFLATFDEETYESSVLKDADGNPYKLEDWELNLKLLEQKILDKIADNDAFGVSSMSLLSEFITEYNKSNRHDDTEYASYKALGIQIMYENLGEVTLSSVESYVKEFKESVIELHERLQKSDNQVLGYTLSDKLTRTSFGEHFIVETPGTNFNKPTFKYTDSTNSYSLGCENEGDKMSKAQFALYIERYAYTQIYGSTADTQENAAFDYPNMPDELIEAFELYYKDWFSLMLDESSTYHSSYINLRYLSGEDTTWKESLTKLRDIYEFVLFGE